ncbi:S8 family peptidase [Pseudomonas aeruginosa]
MAEKGRFLFGRGEKITEQVDFRGGPNNTNNPYTITRQIQRLEKKLDALTKDISKLPKDTLAGGNAVAAVTLHPQFLSRSGFPEYLLKFFDLRLIGSRPKKVKPEAGRGSDSIEGIASTTIFVAGTEFAFENFHDSLADFPDEDENLSGDLVKIEDISLFRGKDKILGEIESYKAEVEVVVHFDSAQDLGWEESLVKYSENSRVNLDMARAYQSRGLLFVPAKATKKAVEKLAEFSFIRAVRPMPKLRTINAPSLVRSKASVVLPTDKPFDESFRVAVFDGGLPADHPFGVWVRAIEPLASSRIGNPVTDLQAHGQAVTSALLFGHVDGALERPYAYVDHYRVLGDVVSDSSLYDVMLYVDGVLSQSSYSLVSFSIGPYQVAGDDEVTAWTAMLDDHLGSGDVLATIAVGNDGDQPWPNSRIQVPSDSVNALSVGASDGQEKGWSRAPYSSIGPGRSPGLVKPDIVSFGGVEGKKFKFVFPGLVTAEDCGTSFATPAAMRVAAGLRAFFGDDLTTTAIKALLVHSADQGGHSRDEVGWGLVDSDIERIVKCADGEIKVLYKGKLEPGKVLRAPIPLPDEELPGKVIIKATFCYSCATDPHVPGEYTRAGLDIKFRPNKDIFETNPVYPKSESFFGRHSKSNEQELRLDAHKWDAVRKSQKSKYGSSLKSPTFDIHYVAREPGKKAAPLRPPKLSYALVVTVINKRTPDLYERIEAKYRNQLMAIVPKVDIPVRIRS